VDIEELPIAGEYDDTLATYPEDNLADLGDEGYSILPDWLTGLGNVLFNEGGDVNLNDHENVNGGHTKQRHVGKDDDYLKDRLANPQKYVPGQTRISGATTYTDQSTAEKVIGQTIADNQAEIEAWLENPNSRDRRTINYEGSDVIGRGINKGDASVTNRTNATTVLKKDGQGGYTILTSYPK
jgi:hypothetical protein